MSYINEALKKAQKEKDALYRKYHGVVSAAKTKPGPFGAKTMLLGAFIFILLAFTTYLLITSKDLQPHTHKSSNNKGGQQAEKPADALVSYKKARFLHKNGRFQEAERLYEETLRFNPDHIESLNNLGVIHIHNKNYSAAKGNFEKAIAIKPDYADPYYNLACLHALQGKVSQGLACLKKAASLDQSVKEWARTDTDLKNLQVLPAFEKMIGSNGVTE